MGQPGGWNSPTASMDVEPHGSSRVDPVWNFVHRFPDMGEPKMILECKWSGTLGVLPALTG